MCFPAIAPALPAILGGLGVAQTGLQYMGARRQAKQQAAYQAQAQAAERQRFQQEQTSLRMRQAQEQEAVGRELEQVSRKSQAALARARVSAGEAGVAGASVQALMDDYMRQEAGYRSALARQQEMGALATGLGLEQAGFATQQRMIGLSQPIDRPSPLGAVIGAVSSGLGGYRTGLDIQSRIPKTPKTTTP
jgi:multidrug efflux pump subunit AcrA (membrane-fusion protein)